MNGPVHGLLDFCCLGQTNGFIHSLAWEGPIACGRHVCQSFCKVAVLLGTLRILLLWIHTIQIMLLCGSTIVGPQACSQRSARTEPRCEHSPRTKADIKVRSNSSESLVDSGPAEPDLSTSTAFVQRQRSKYVPIVLNR